ncbi:MAG: hypothetical protein ABW162_10800 [Candidatus Sedimenticola sp. PURPLELP]
MSSTPLFSSAWYRIANLRPRLRSHTQIHHHRYRGELWYLIQDHITGRFHRFTPETYTVIGMLDGTRTLDQVWETACERLGDDMPSQDEVIRLLGQLHRADIIQANLPPDMTELHRRHQKQQRSLWLAKLRSPLAVKIPLWDPNRFLDRTAWLARLLFSPFGWVVWIGITAAALLLAAVHWEPLTENLADRVLALENMLLLWLVYPVVKGVHEFGHGYAVKRRGGEVHEMGIMFLVFIPVPYVEASASYAFANKFHRMLVGAAGIMTEMFLAALAMIVWSLVEPGAVRAIAFNVMIISGISTLLFNGNPLLRFDAYYVLSDFLEIPNLGIKSNKQLGYLLRHYLLGVKSEPSPARTFREGVWLVAYSMASFCYRMFIMLTIALFVASKLFIVGGLLALWSIYGFLIHPFIKMTKNLMMDTEIKRRRGRLYSVTGTALMVILALLFWLPVPKMTLAEGILWVPGQNRIVTEAEGRVEKVLVDDGTAVTRDQPLLICSNYELDTEILVLEGRMRELASRNRIAQSQGKKTESRLIEEEVQRLQQQLNRLLEQRNALMIKSPTEGNFHFSLPDHLPGRYLGRGVELGYVLEEADYRARVLVNQSDIDAVRNDVQGVSVRFAEQMDRIYPANLLQEIPGAHRELPSLALSVKGGGQFALDPESQDLPRAYEAFFQYELALAEVPAYRVGERIYVRIEHTPEPIGFRWLREARRVLLEQLDI